MHQISFFFKKKKSVLLDLKTKNTSIINSRDFNALLSLTDGFSGKKKNREISKLNGIIDQMDLTKVCRVFHPNNKELHILLSNSYKLLYIRPHTGT